MNNNVVLILTNHSLRPLRPTFITLDSQTTPERYLYESIDDVVVANRWLVPYDITKEDMTLTVLRCFKHHPEYLQELKQVIYYYDIDPNIIKEVLKRLDGLSGTSF